MTKSEVLNALSEGTGLSKKEVQGVFDELAQLIERQLGKKGPGVFTVPGLMKIQRVHKPATKAGVRPNPFKPGEMMEVKAKPAKNTVRARALKKCRDREFVSEQVAHLMRTAKVTRQKALEAIREAGPSREKVIEYLGKR
jgi:nucleoid DNA-binding protein